jgi:hypothetical protein
MSTVIDAFSVTKPLPRQPVHGLLIVLPAPRQFGQLVCTRKIPVDWITWPRPPQVAQTIG